jgi:hypothetical protein
MKKLFLAIGLLGAFAIHAAERYVPEYLDKISVNVQAGAGYNKSEGSGTLFVRQVDGKKAVFVWTAGHVIQHTRTVEEIIVEGKPAKKITFENPKLLRQLKNKDGKRVGEITVDARVVRFSPANKNDLALLLVLSEDGFEAEESAEFYPKGGPLPRIGARLHHCGSFLGQDASNSYSAGHLSANGRMLFKVDFFQSTTPAYPGSSGGIVADDKGRYVGTLVRGAGETFNLSVPVARQWKWASANGVEWAMNPKLPITMKEIDALPIEGPSEGGGTGDGRHKNFPFLIRVEKLNQNK